MRVRLLLFIWVLTAAGCASTPSPFQGIHDDLLAKYTPVRQPVEDDVYINHSGEEPFTGDCDDFHAAARNQLLKYGFTPLSFTGYENGKFHVFTCGEYGNRVDCLDPNFTTVHPLKLMENVYSRVRTIRY